MYADGFHSPTRGNHYSRSTKSYPESCPNQNKIDHVVGYVRIPGRIATPSPKLHRTKSRQFGFDTKSSRGAPVFTMKFWVGPSV